MTMNDIDDMFYKMNVYDLMAYHFVIKFDDRFATLINDFFFNCFCHYFTFDHFQLPEKNDKTYLIQTFGRVKIIILRKKHRIRIPF